MSLQQETLTTGFDIKSNIIFKYFDKWSARTIAHIQANGLEEKFVFADLCFGHSLSDNDEHSPLFKILESSIQSIDLSNMLFSVFNELHKTPATYFNAMLEVTEDIEKLRFTPFSHQSNVDDKLLLQLKKVTHLPTFAILDILNYEGITFDFLNNLVEGSGDCLIHFDYKKIALAINKPKQREQMLRIFGEQDLQQLQDLFKTKPNNHRKEQAILNTFCTRLARQLGIIAPPFCYKFCTNKGKTDHFLIFITKHQGSYEMMRKILTEESQIIEDGIGNLCFNPKINPTKYQKSQTFFGAMFQLEQALLKTFKQKTLQVEDIYSNFHFGKTYIKQNYLDALRNLDAKKQITIQRKMNRFGHLPSINDSTFVSFNR